MFACPGPQPRQPQPGGRSGPWPDLASGPDSERILHAQQGIAGLPPSRQPGPRLAQATSTARQGPPGSDPDPGPRLRRRGYGTGQQVGIGADDARWRRSEGFIARSPGCRQGTILAPDAAWQLLPSSKKGGPTRALGHFGSTTRPHGRGEVSSAAKRSSGEGLERTRRAVPHRAIALRSRR